MIKNARSLQSPEMSRKLALRLVAFGAAALSAATALGTPGRGFQYPVAGSRLDPGTEVIVSWQLPSVPEGDEMELVLSLDGGDTFPVRLTRSLSPSASAAAWRVPALPSPRARLALRTGESGEVDRETLVFQSGIFSISADPRAGAEPLFASDGEWRTSEARDGRRDLPSSGAFLPGVPGPAFERDADALPISSPRPPVLTSPARVPVSRERAPVPSALSRPTRRPGSSSLEAPLRV